MGFEESIVVTNINNTKTKSCKDSAEFSYVYFMKVTFSVMVLLDLSINIESITLFQFGVYILPETVN